MSHVVKSLGELARDRVRGVILAVWIAALIFWMRHDILDDAFIHLRYAEQLLAHRFLTYDGVTASQGTSSVLYVFALAGLAAVRRWPYWPKALAIAGYVVLWVGVWRQRRALGAWTLVVVVVLASPTAIRTLTDGMETSWAAAAAAFVAIQITRARSEVPPVELARLAVIGAAIALLRVDLLPIVLAGVAASWLSGRGRVGGALALGSAVALIALVAGTGAALLPDDALAKNLGWSRGIYCLTRAPIAHVAAMSFGLGLFALWVASWWRVHRGANPQLRRAALVVNMTGPSFWTVALLSGQLSYGIRYFVPSYVFATTWNLLSAPPATWPASPHKKGFGRLALVMLAGAWALEVIVLRPVVQSRSSTLLALQGAGLERFRGQPAIALDVGQIGYFSGADICDVRGLVNGRELAVLGLKRRAELCWARRPVFAFMTESEARRFPWLASWPVCGEFAMNNVRGRDLFRLRTRPDIGCGLEARP